MAEHAQSIIDNVDNVLSCNWPELVEDTLGRVVRSKWRFGENIDVDELYGYDDLDDFLF